MEQGAGSKEQSVQTSSTLESLKPKGEFAVKEGAIKEKAEGILWGVYQYELPKSFHAYMQMLAKNVNRATVHLSRKTTYVIGPLWLSMFLTILNDPQLPLSKQVQQMNL